MATRRFELEVVPPFRLDLTAWTLRRRTHNTVDRFDGSYRRVLEIRGRGIEAVVNQEPRANSGPVVVKLRSSSTVLSGRDEDEVRILLRRVLGLDVELAGFYRLARHDERLSALASRFRGMRPPRFPSLFECLVNAIACQQLSLTVGIHLLNRLAVNYGPRIGNSGGLAGFPSAPRLATTRLEELRAFGFSGAKARAIKGLADQVASGGLGLDDLEHLKDDKVRAALLAIPGVGRWSAEYVMLRGLGRLQVLPGDDVGARNNLRRRYGLDPSAGYDEVSELAREWWPYGGLVYFHLLLDSLAQAGHLGGMQP
jgi:DNA-3-methyladenine glycosylase II